MEKLPVICADCGTQNAKTFVEYDNGDCRCFACAGKFVDEDSQEKQFFGKDSLAIVVK